ncbi:MAG TPA: hypothetical protein VGE07_15340 [Herpetosiphonaceae bacterium]
MGQNDEQKRRSEPNDIEPTGSPTPDGRRIRGEGLAHEQDYIEERLTYGSSTNEYADAAEQLKRDSEEIDRLTRERGGNG